MNRHLKAARQLRCDLCKDDTLNQRERAFIAGIISGAYSRITECVNYNNDDRSSECDVKIPTVHFVSAEDSNENDEN